MYQCRLQYLMMDAKIYSLKECMQRTGLGYSTIAKLIYNENLETVKMHSLQAVCDCFHCRLSDLIEYIPD